jgi:hypothetical protein
MASSHGDGENESLKFADPAVLPRLRQLLFRTLDQEYSISERPANMLRAFRAMDVSGSGHLSRAHFDAALTRLGMWLHLSQRALLFKAIDSDNDQLVSMQDFIEFQSRPLEKRAEAKRDSSKPKRVTDPDEGVEDDGDDFVDLARAMRRRRVGGAIGQQLQRRFRDYAVGDALLFALDGMTIDPHCHANSSGNNNNDDCVVALMPEEVSLVLQRAQCPVSAAEERWLGRTFSAKAASTTTRGGGLGQQQRAAQLSSSSSYMMLDAGPLVSFAFGARDPWASSNGGGGCELEELLLRVTPEEHTTPQSAPAAAPASSFSSSTQWLAESSEVRLPNGMSAWAPRSSSRGGGNNKSVVSNHRQHLSSIRYDEDGGDDDDANVDNDKIYRRSLSSFEEKKMKMVADQEKNRAAKHNGDDDDDEEGGGVAVPFGSFEWVLGVTSANGPSAVDGLSGSHHRHDYYQQQPHRDDQQHRDYQQQHHSHEKNQPKQQSFRAQGEKERRLGRDTLDDGGRAAGRRSGALATWEWEKALFETTTTTTAAPMQQQQQEEEQQQEQQQPQHQPQQHDSKAGPRNYEHPLLDRLPTIEHTLVSLFRRRFETWSSTPNNTRAARDKHRLSSRAFFDFIDSDGDGLLGPEDVTLAVMEEWSQLSSSASASASSASAVAPSSAAAPSAGNGRSLPCPPLPEVREFITSARKAAGRSLGADDPCNARSESMTAGEVRRWLGLSAMTTEAASCSWELREEKQQGAVLDLLRAKGAAALEMMLDRMHHRHHSRSSSNRSNSASRRISRNQEGNASVAAAGLLFGAVRRPFPAGSDGGVYDGPTPPSLVSVPALTKAFRRLNLPFTHHDITALASAFPGGVSSSGDGNDLGGPRGFSARIVDFDAVVDFLVT